MPDSYVLIEISDGIYIRTSVAHDHKDAMIAALRDAADALEQPTPKHQQVH